jgi:hypothetical protein
MGSGKWPHKTSGSIMSLNTISNGHNLLCAPGVLHGLEHRILSRPWPPAPSRAVIGTRQTQCVAFWFLCRKKEVSDHGDKPLQSMLKRVGVNTIQAVDQPQRYLISCFLSSTICLLAWVELSYMTDLFLSCFTFGCSASIHCHEHMAAQWDSVNQ